MSTNMVQEEHEAIRCSNGNKDSLSWDDYKSMSFTKNVSCHINLIHRFMSALCQTLMATSFLGYQRGAEIRYWKHKRDVTKENSPESRNARYPILLLSKSKSCSILVPLFYRNLIIFYLKDTQFPKDGRAYYFIKSPITIETTTKTLLLSILDDGRCELCPPCDLESKINVIYLNA